MHDDKLLAAHKGRLFIIGFGSIAKGVLPLILRHIKLQPGQIHIISSDSSGQQIAEKLGVHQWTCFPLTPSNYQAYFKPRLHAGDFVLNLSVAVSSFALIELCQEVGALYLDTCIEPWEGRYIDAKLSVTERSNYALREEALSLRKRFPNGPTAILAHGANPGLVSHFVKQALLNIAKDANGKCQIPKTRTEWGELAKKLGIKVIHIAERDTQQARVPKKFKEFVNTWSVDGFVSEGSQPSELGWGTHEKHLPPDGSRHGYGCDAAIYLNRPGGSVKVRSWTPQEGPYHGFLIAHNEAISLADYFSLYSTDGKPIYRPTVNYAYHPCNDAVLSLHELAGKNWKSPEKKRILMDEIEGGVDELGVLLMGNPKGSYWYGSVLSTEEARKLAPYNNATSLQVASGVLAGVIYALKNSRLGVVEAEDLDFERILTIANPYLGRMYGTYTDWTPLKERQALFAEKVDLHDPWQFQNFLMV